MSSILEAIRQIQARTAAAHSAPPLADFDAFEPPADEFPVFEDQAALSAAVEMPVEEYQPPPLSEAAREPVADVEVPVAEEFAPLAEEVPAPQPAVEEPPAPPPLAVDERPRSVVTIERPIDEPGDEAYRSIARSIRKAFSGPAPVSIALANLSGTVDVAAIAAGLARALVGLSDQQVLLITARVSPMARAASAVYESRHGLTDIVAGRLAWQEAVCTTIVDGLHILSPGLSAWPAIDERRVWEPLCAELKQRFRFLVFDLGMAEEAAGSGLAASCDGVYLIAELGQTDRFRAQQAAQQMRASGSALRGCILVDPKSEP